MLKITDLKGQTIMASNGGLILCWRLRKLLKQLTDLIRESRRPQQLISEIHSNCYLVNFKLAAVRRVNYNFNDSHVELLLVIHFENYFVLQSQLRKQTRIATVDICALHIRSLSLPQFKKTDDINSTPCDYSLILSFLNRA